MACFSRCVVVTCLWWILAWQGHGGGVFIFLQGHDMVRLVGRGRGGCSMADVGCGFLGFVNLWVFVKGKLFWVLQVF